jgi:hypothetical protein
VLFSAHSASQPRRRVQTSSSQELIYRLCTKALLRHIIRPDFLLLFLFGVGTKEE